MTKGILEAYSKSKNKNLVKTLVQMVHCISMFSNISNQHNSKHLKRILLLSISCRAPGRSWFSRRERIKRGPWGERTCGSNWASRQSHWRARPRGIPGACWRARQARNTGSSRANWGTGGGWKTRRQGEEESRVNE